MGILLYQTVGDVKRRVTRNSPNAHFFTNGLIVFFSYIFTAILPIDGVSVAGVQIPPHDFREFHAVINLAQCHRAKRATTRDACDAIIRFEQLVMAPAECAA
jgi:hypothetical protein